MLEVVSLEMPAESVGQLQEHRDREFQILGDATDKLQVPNAVRLKGTVSRLVQIDVIFV